MAFIYYGEYIRKAREKAGLSMEQCAEGICSIQTLYRAENNKAGLSAIVFQAIMSRCGESQEVFPIFINWDDYECFDAMCNIEMWINSWQVEEAYRYLKQIERINFADNSLYYQKWLYYYAYMMNRAASKDYAVIDQILNNAILITKTYMDINNMQDEQFTDTEVHILTLLSENCIAMGDNDRAGIILKQLEQSISDKAMGEVAKARLLIGVRKTIALLLISTDQIEEALTIISETRAEAFRYSAEEHYIDVAFLYGLSEYLSGNERVGFRYMRAACYSSDAIKAQFTRKAINLLYMLGLNINEVKEAAEFCPEEITFPVPDIDKHFDEVYSNNTDENFVTYGMILKKRRKDQKVSAKIISQGLCTESYYSKIESGKAQPDVFLARALMQRLGISDEPFTFFVSKMEAEQYALERQFRYVEKHEKEKISEYIDKLERLCKKNDNKILGHWCEIMHFYYVCNDNDRSVQILNSIREHLQGFEPERMNDFRLDRLEISSMMVYCHALRYEGHISKAISVLYILLRYIEAGVMSDLYKDRINAMVLGTLVNMLGIQDRNDEIMELKDIIARRINYTNLYKLPTMYAHLSTIYTSKNAYSAREYALYTYYMFVLCEIKFDEKFKKDMGNRVGKDLDYCY